MAPTSTLRSLTVVIVAALTITAASIGLFALVLGGEDLTADAQTDGCWTTVWGTDNDGYFFSVVAGDGCPDYRGRVFAGAFQRGPTIPSTGGVAKMTGVDACTYDTVEVKAVDRVAESVLYRFTWTAEQLGCDAPTTTSGPSTTSTTPSGSADTTTTTTTVTVSAGYVPFPGALVGVTRLNDGCELTVTGSGNADHDVTLNGIAKLVNGTVAAQPFFSFWIAPEGGNRWTEGAFHAASLTEGCEIDVHRTLSDPPSPPSTTTTTPTASAAPTTTTTAAPATTTTLSAPTTTVATSPEPPSSDFFEFEVDGDELQIYRCGDEFGTELVCIRLASDAWINVDAVDGFGRFDRLDGNTVIYALEGDLLRVAIRTESRVDPIEVNIRFD